MAKPPALRRREIEMSINAIARNIEVEFRSFAYTTLTHTLIDIEGLLNSLLELTVCVLLTIFTQFDFKHYKALGISVVDMIIPSFLIIKMLFALEVKSRLAVYVDKLMIS